MASPRAALVAAALARACRLDVVAFKPGNVSLCAPGHGMHARDFLFSARVAVPCLVAGPAVGVRIEAAIEATLRAVGCNTNLGIVLLLAPLAAAADVPGGALRAHLRTVLASLTVDDAACCYRAIRRAAPAGLGRVAVQDVAAAPGVDLHEAMRLAAEHDSVARQYVSGFADVFELGVPALRAARARWRSLAWATTACFMTFVAGIPDTHVRRKWGASRARAVQARAREVEKALKACENPRRILPVLKAFDDELKSSGINPGTSADLTVASVSAMLLQDRLYE